MFNQLLAFEFRLEQQQIAIDTSVGSVNVAPRNDYRSHNCKYNGNAFLRTSPMVATT